MTVRCEAYLFCTALSAELIAVGRTMIEDIPLSVDFLDTSMVPSDVSEALEGVMEAKYLFAGEYLTPYKWAQERRKELISLL